jgi:hypothetical protein
LLNREPISASSSPAQAGDPVITSVAGISQAVDTGCPAFAGHDEVEIGRVDIVGRHGE